MIGVIAASAAALLALLRADWAPRGRPTWRLVEHAVGLFCMLGMLYAAAVQVLVRYALADYVDLPWTEEFSRLLLVWAAMWGAAILQRSDDHISMTVVFDWLPPRGQLALRLAGDVVALAVLGVVAWFGWLTAVRQLVMSTVSLGLPISVFIAPVPLAATLMIVHGLVIIARRLRGLPVGEGTRLPA
jgi:TRAP-type C4-dicarboxylate transport system permease small subunit